MIASGTSQRHVKGIADKIQQTLKLSGEEPISVSGNDQAEWVLIDYIDVVVHVFQKHIREFYDIEGLWGDARVTSVATTY